MLQLVFDIWIYIIEIQLQHIPSDEVFSEKYSFFFQNVIMKWTFLCDIPKFRKKIFEVFLAFLVHPKDAIPNPSIPEKIYELVIDFDGCQKYLDEWLLILARMATLKDPSYCQRGWTGNELIRGQGRAAGPGPALVGPDHFYCSITFEIILRRNL